MGRKKQLSIQLLTKVFLSTFLVMFFLPPTVLAADGDLDTTFGGTGIVTTAMGTGKNIGYSVAVQADGKIVVAGRSTSGLNYDFAVARYNSDGSLDTSFNGSGKVVTPIRTSDDYGYSVAIQADGKIVAAGFSFNGSTNDFAVVRYNPDGSLDTSFNGSGKVTTPIGDAGAGYSVAIQADGKIVVAGFSYNGLNNDFAVVRYNTDGSLDISFNGSGKVTTPIGVGEDVAYSVAIQADGKIVVAGYCSNGVNYDFAVVRYNANGSLDTSFNGTGKVTTPIGANNEKGYSVAIQADGKIVVAGYSRGDNDDFAVVRYNPDGSLDTSFNGSGKVTTPIGTSNDYGYSVAIQADGKIVVAGSSNPTDRGPVESHAFTIVENYNVAVVRYNADGSLDTTFKGTGKVTTATQSSADDRLGMAIQADGKIVVAGSSDDGTEFNFAVVRYMGTPPPPSITSITPNSGLNTGPVNITNLAGANFQNGAVVKLKMAGQTDITATSVVVVSSTKITCTFDLTGATAGTWDVFVQNPDSQNTTLAGGFQVASSIPPINITAITPNSGANTGPVNITNLAGQGFVNGTLIKLKKDGQTDIIATNVTIVSLSQITCTFDLTGATTGVWDVYGETPDGGNSTLAGGFTVTNAPVTPVSPTLVFTSPYVGSYDVPTNARIKATFNKDMDAATLTGATFTLNSVAAGTTRDLSATITYDAATRTAIITPASNLSPKTQYQASLTTGIKSAEGGALAADVSWTFTLGNTTDSDGDGVPDDHDQYPSDPTKATITTAWGSYTLDVSATPGATLSGSYPILDSDPGINQSGKPADMVFPAGLLTFEVNGITPGATVPVTLTYPLTIPADSKYYKVGGDGFQEYAKAVISGNTLTLTLTDGQVPGDADGMANSTIKEPGGLAVLTPGGGGGGGGGCFILTTFGGSK